MEFIITYSGEEFIPVKPDINKIHIEDIAHSLSLMCRGNGHIDYFFSVAQHSINCTNEAKARGCTARVQLICLLHDASEAYISDITRPVKFYLNEYKEIERHLQGVIYTKFLGEVPTEDEINFLDQIDNEMLVVELSVLMANKNIYTTIPKLRSTPSLDFKPHSDVETEYLKVYYGIMHAGLIQGR